MAILQISNTYGFVVLVVVLTIVAYQWMGIEVGKARKKYDVRYPTMYADEDKNKNAKAFNCIQRGHQNSLEILPQFLVMLLISGVPYPVTASLAGVLFVIGRVFYFTGYSTGEPKRRMDGSVQYLGLVTLLALTAWTSVRMLIAPHPQE
eukprot:TRINITY_DN274_c0_g1_i4.p1 TRINITY_DN274_c0_g1~~TRINITY_DN274_c0_g1_i4.p1  ORF type:complete len:149 (-),score=29.90 TRINITY_DN274_c0_g1_i4:1428-1874(-)